MDEVSFRYKRTRNDWIGGLIGLVIVLPTACCILFGLFVFAVHWLLWLQTAAWPKQSILNGLNYIAGPLSLGAGWVGFDKIVAGVVDLPLEVGLVLILPAAWIAGWMVIFNYILKMLEPRKR
jgi:hypothetical protein